MWLAPSVAIPPIGNRDVCPIFLSPDKRGGVPELHRGHLVAHGAQKTIPRFLWRLAFCQLFCRATTVFKL